MLQIAEFPTFNQVKTVVPLVTVKPKFQVTIPAKLRKDLDLREGDVMEASVVADGILLRPKEEAVDRDVGARRVAAVLARLEPPPEDVGRSEYDIMEDIVADIAAAREERRRDA